jgi:hypothetical protein
MAIQADWGINFPLSNLRFIRGCMTCWSFSDTTGRLKSSKDEINLKNQANRRRRRGNKVIIVY